MSADNPKPMDLEECVRNFLQLALVPPEKPAKTQRAQRESTFTILGFNRAQETLRSILSVHGDSPAVKALADERSDKQQRPMDGPGGSKVWVVS